MDMSPTSNPLYKKQKQIKQGRIKEKIAGIYLGKLGAAELTLGMYNPARVNSIKYYTAYDYNGMWELSVVTIGYKGTVNYVYERRGLIMLNVPYIIIPLSIISE